MGKLLGALAMIALAGAIPALAQTEPLGITAMPPSDEGQTRGALGDSLLALSYAHLNARALALESLRTADNARKRQAEVRAKILDLIGGLPDRGTVPAQVTASHEGDGFRVENIRYDVAGMKATANLYLPATAPTGKMPAIAYFPGHWDTGKLSSWAFGTYMARQGYAVLAVDLPGEGEMLQYFDATTAKSRVGGSTSEHGMDAFAVAATGDHVARYFIALGMRAIDYLESRSDVDARRIGTFGCSGGGTMASYVSALDPRVAAAASACWINDFAHILPVRGPQEAEQTLHGFISSGLDMPDWMELMAPKPVAVVSTTADMFPFIGARAAVEEARKFWGLFGQAQAVSWIYGPGSHANLAPIHGEIADFFHRAFGTRTLDPRPAPAFEVPPEWVPRLLVNGGTLAITGGQGTTIQAMNAARAAVLAARPPTVADAAALATVRTRLEAAVRRRAAIGVAPAVKFKGEPGPAANVDGLSIRPISFEGAMGALPAAWIEVPGAQGPVLLLMEETGLDTASPRARALARAGWRVLALHARAADGIERTVVPLLGNLNRMALRALVVGRTIPGIRTDDIVAALDWLQAQGLRATVMASGNATVPAAHAALLDDRVDGLILEGGLVSWGSALALPMQRGLAAMLVPGAIRDYDLPDLLTATRACRVTLIDPRDGMGAPARTALLDKAYAPARTWLKDRLRIGAAELTPAAQRC